jgi:F0F1-type ATP synthase assembly protein I
VDQQAERRELYNGFGDGLALAFQIALTPVIFGGLGYLIDRWIDKVPLFTIVLFLVSMIGVFLSQWLQYEYRMQQADAKAVWRKRPATGADA